MLTPTYFWLGKDGQPRMEWKWHNGLTMEIQKDGTLKPKFREWIKVPA